jgi:hypothetical protein
MEMKTDPHPIECKKRPTNTSSLLSSALLMIGAGAGLLLGHFLDETYYRMEDEVAYFSMLFICGGLGLAASYVIAERKQRAKKKNESGR